MLITQASFLKIAPERRCDHKFEREIEVVPSLGGDSENWSGQRSLALKRRKVKFIRGPAGRDVFGTAWA